MSIDIFIMKRAFLICLLVIHFSQHFGTLCSVRYNKGAHLFLPSYIMRTHGAKQQREALRRAGKDNLSTVFEVCVVLICWLILTWDSFFLFSAIFHISLCKNVITVFVSLIRLLIHLVTPNGGSTKKCLVS